MSKILYSIVIVIVWPLIIPARVQQYLFSGVAIQLFSPRAPLLCRSPAKRALQLEVNILRSLYIILLKNVTEERLISCHLKIGDGRRVGGGGG